MIDTYIIIKCIFAKSKQSYIFNILHPVCSYYFVYVPKRMVYELFAISGWHPNIIWYFGGIPTYEWNIFKECVLSVGIDNLLTWIYIAVRTGRRRCISKCTRNEYLFSWYMYVYRSITGIHMFCDELNICYCVRASKKCSSSKGLLFAATSPIAWRLRVHWNSKRITHSCRLFASCCCCVSLGAHICDRFVSFLILHSLQLDFATLDMHSR